MPARVPRGHFQVFESSGFFSYAERWPSGRRRTPAKGVRVKSPSRVRIPLSPPVQILSLQRLSFLRSRVGGVLVANSGDRGGETPSVLVAEQQPHSTQGS